MKDKDYYGHSHLFELTTELPSVITNSLVTSYKVHDYLKNAVEIIKDVETLNDIGITGIRIVSNPFCPENTGYLFDHKGDLQVIIFNFEEEEK